MKQNPYLHLIRTMWRYAPDKKLFFWMIVFAIISKLIWIAEPYVFGKIINIIQLEGEAGWDKIIFLLIFFASMTFFNRCFNWFSRVWEEKIKFQVSEACIADLFHQVSSLSMSRHTENHSGKIVDKINKASSALKDFAGSNFMYLTTAILGVGSFVSLSLIRRPAGLIIIILAALTAIIVIKFDLKLSAMITEKNEKEHEVMSGLFDFLGNIKTIITLRFTDRALITIRQRVAAIYPVFKKYTIWNESKWFTMDMLMAISVLIILGLYLRDQFSNEGVVLIGTLTMLRQYIDKMRSAFDDFTWQWSGLMQMSTDLHTVDEIMSQYQALTPVYHKPRRNHKQIFHIRDLTFSYKNQDRRKTVLQDISIDLVPGKRIALVGSSGGGKSTLMMLLRGLYPVDQVALTIGKEGFDTLEPLSHYTSLIPQEPEIFENTIRYNITMGVDADDATIYKYLDMARFTEVVESLPQGLDTDIKEKGVNLSGGQKQRLALARGLFMSTQSHILLLDESTSSVDVHNEKIIYEQIFHAHPDLCIVASIHKLHLLPMFDIIYLLKKGKIVEQGSFVDLTNTPESQLSILRDDYQGKITQKTAASTHYTLVPYK